MTARGEPSPGAAGEARRLNGSRFAVGVIEYRAYEELEACLASVGEQTIAPRWVRVVDSGGKPEDLARALRAWPEVEQDVRENRGYGYAANRLIERAVRDGDCDYLLLLNPDVVLDPGFIAAMQASLDADPGAALGGGRLVRPRDRRIDSAGIVLGRNRRPRDRGMGELDSGQFSAEEVVFGVSGAALCLRIAALRDLEVNGEIFDEDFFAYHDETDIAWRAALMGWHARYVPTAQATHERGWKPGERFEIPVRIRRHSFKNHTLQRVKNDRPLEWLRDLPLIVVWEVTRFLFALLRDPAILPAYVDLVRLLPRALRKRRIIQRRATGRVRWGA